MEWHQKVLTSPLKWYRSWPLVVPQGRAYVHDHLPKLGMSNCDYSTVEGGLPKDDPGFCMLEWDVALAFDERVLFAELALGDPTTPLVAPYTKTYGGAVLNVQRRMGYLPIERGAPYADFVGFGCIYLPQRILAEYRAAVPGPFTDTTFSNWHWQAYGPIAVTWEIHPQHLHGD